MTNNGAQRYAEARRILRDASKAGLVLTRYYNGYTSGTKTLKVYWWAMDHQAAVDKVHKELLKMVDYHRTDARGGDIYGFFDVVEN